VLTPDVLLLSTVDADKRMSENEPLEIAATLGQKCLENSPVIILGSGASIPYGLPSMEDIRDHLVRLDLPENLKEFSENWNKLTYNLYKADVEQALSTINGSDKLYGFVRREIWYLINSADLKLRDNLLRDEQTLALTKLYQHLLSSTNAELSVVTPNYDRLAEYAANLTANFSFTGFTSGNICEPKGIPHNLPQKARFEAGHDKIVKIWKVHGSLDWFKTIDGEIKSLPNASAIPFDLETVIIPPSNGKYADAHQEPYRSIIANADTALKNANSFLCVGYGFNDAHIEPKLRLRWKRSGNIPLVILTKKLSQTSLEIISSDTARNFLALEQDEANPTSTKMFSSEFGNGVVLENCSLWNLEDFLSHSTGA
jgi:hypothetical protein